MNTLMLRAQKDPHFDVHVLVTVMHMLSPLCSTTEEVRTAGLTGIYRFVNPDAHVVNPLAVRDLAEVDLYYGCDFSAHAFLLVHPVTTEDRASRREVRVVVDEMLASGKNFVVRSPNNDPGAEIILEEYERLRN